MATIRQPQPGTMDLIAVIALVAIAACLDRDLLKMNRTIGFAVHGIHATVAIENITRKVKRG